MQCNIVKYMCISKVLLFLCLGCAYVFVDEWKLFSEIHICRGLNVKIKFEGRQFKDRDLFLVLKEVLIFSFSLN